MMTYAKSRPLLWRGFVVITLIAVIYHASLYLLCTTYIIETGASQDFLDKVGVIPTAPSTVFLGSIAGKPGQMHANKHPHTMHTNKLKVTERFKYNIRHHQTPRRKHRQNIL